MPFAIPPISQDRFNNLTATPNITTPGIRLTASATPHAKGAYGVLSAATPHDVYEIELAFSGSAASNTRTDMMFDLAIGPAGQETVIVPEYLIGWKPAITTGPFRLVLPLFIPKGTRVAMRIQALIASDVIDVLAFFRGAGSGLPPQTYRRADAFGTNAASSTGTSHTPGNSGVESTAANVGGVLTRTYSGVMLGVNGTLAITAQTAIAYHWELLLGGVAIAEWYVRGHTTEEVQGPIPSVVRKVIIPAGSQLQVRAEASGTAQTFDVAFYCFY